MCILEMSCSLFKSYYMKKLVIRRQGLPEGAEDIPICREMQGTEPDLVNSHVHLPEFLHVGFLTIKILVMRGEGV